MSSETSEKFVPAPDQSQVTGDLTIAIKRFRNSVRWKEFHRQRREEAEGRLGEEDDDCYRTPRSADGDSGCNFDFKQESSEGLRTGVRPKQRESMAPRGSDELEAFLKDVERELISQVLDEGRFKYKEDKRSKDVKRVRKLLAQTDLVAIPTDKTNSYRTVKTEDYKKWVIKHLAESSAEIPRSKVVEVYHQAKEFLEELQPSLSENEFAAILESIESKAVPTPKLLIKDHKKPDANGDFPTRLVVPATNFTAAFPNIGYRAIKKIFDDNNIAYGTRTIIQASDLK